ncbi:DNA gyrase subunit A [Candidatus Termititenax dinenymphae]|uniref:DNA gyrase subunit A n=1 Tax=Candidatus Termititenax dinenymphae TaxID=2218523 RepID=A0A388TJP2_9BACT|nr:DNA gyrase subunit A [Candidatus Termititenax dinenymphae]
MAEKKDKDKKDKKDKSEQVEQAIVHNPRIKPLIIEEEMQNSYINYAMSVIVGRALPDVRDGLKPVHRRVLFSMFENGITRDKAYRKSATTVGDVLGKYHPHGDSSVYDALVRLAQEFSLRYPLVDGQGNFGSIDGDSAAAMRYTEARLARISDEMLVDLDLDTVDFMPNYDESLKEPVVLPTRIPNLLVNGSSGIAVGMATNIPPHNLGEICDGLAALIDDPDLPEESLLMFVKGPDFPTGGNIVQVGSEDGIRNIYLTGRGSVTVRAQVSIEPAHQKKDRQCIIVSELPYQVNKAELIIRIANLVKDKKIQNIADLRDESGQQGMRIYIELKKEASPDVVLNQLYKHTSLQLNFNAIMLAIVDGVPRVCTLKQILQYFIEHRTIVVTRRTKFLLQKAKDKAHILEGLMIAQDNIDAVVAIIRKSKAKADAKENLMKKFKLSDKQADAILEMRLHQLTALEAGKLRADYDETKKQIVDYEEILGNKKRLMKVIKKELEEVKTKYGDARRTRVLGKIDEVSIEDLIPEEEVAVFLTRSGFVKRMPLTAFRNQQRGGRGVSGMETREEDQIDSIFITNTHSYMVIFTDKGKVYRIKVYEIPDASRNSKGQSITNFVQLEEGERITATIEVESFTKEKQYLFMATKNGTVKKTEVHEFENMRRSGIIAITLDEGDSLDWAAHTDGKKDVLITTANGVIIRFDEEAVRSMGRNAAGVRGINLDKGDYVVSMDILEKNDKDNYAIIVSQNGYGKRTKVDEYRQQGRAGRGVRCVTLRDKDKAVKMRIAGSKDSLIIITSTGIIIRQKVKDISEQGRAAMGVRLIKLDKDDSVVDIGVVKTEEE